MRSVWDVDHEDYRGEGGNEEVAHRQDQWNGCPVKVEELSSLGQI